MRRRGASIVCITILYSFASKSMRLCSWFDDLKAICYPKYSRRLPIDQTLINLPIYCVDECYVDGRKWAVLASRIIKFSKFSLVYRVVGFVTNKKFHACSVSHRKPTTISPSRSRLLTCWLCCTMPLSRRTPGWWPPFCCAVYSRPISKTSMWR